MAGLREASRSRPQSWSTVPAFAPLPVAIASSPPVRGYPLAAREVLGVGGGDAAAGLADQGAVAVVAPHAARICQCSSVASSQCDGLLKTTRQGCDTALLLSEACSYPPW